MSWGRRSSTVLAVFACSLLCAAADARGQGSGESAPAGQEEEPAKSAGLPWFRLELTGRLQAPLVSKVKHGPGELISGFTMKKDAHLREPGWGYAALLDVRVLSWASVGALAWTMHAKGRRSHIHYEGLTLNGRSFPGHTRARTEVTIRYAELSLRYIWTNKPKLLLWFGIGPGWVSYRIALRSKPLRATARMETVFAPSLTYMVRARVTTSLSLFLGSGIAISPARFPSVVTDFRTGLAFELGAGFQLTLAFNYRNGFLSDLQEKFGDRPNHDWKRVRWSNAALELGLAFWI